MIDRKRCNKAVWSLILGVALAVVSGCSSPRNVLWTADSSAIVFPDKSGRLIQYDLKRKARKILVADSSNTPWPAISQDGKTLVTGRLTYSRQKGSRVIRQTLQFTFYDTTTGRRSDQSRSFEFSASQKEPAKKSETGNGQLGLNWSGPADKLLVVGVGGEVFAKIYDLKKEKLIAIDAIPAPFHNRPVRPDGKGFLAFPVRPAEAANNKMLFYDWDGWETNLGTLPPMKKSEQMVGFAWHGKMYQLRTTERIIDIDTETRKISERKAPADVLPAAGWKLKSMFPFAGGQSLLCIFEKTSTSPTTYRVEVQRPATRQRRVVLSLTDSMQLYPSPDDKLVALRSDGNKSDRILIVNDKGEIVADVTSR